MNGEPNELTTKRPRQCFTIQLVFKKGYGENGFLPSVHMKRAGFVQDSH